MRRLMTDMEKGEPVTTRTRPDVSTSTRPADDTTITRRGDGLTEQLRRRRRAALRLPPLECGHRDVLLCLAAADGSDGQLRAWAAAAHHLRSVGLDPLPPADVAAALRRRGWWA